MHKCWKLIYLGLLTLLFPQDKTDLSATITHENLTKSFLIYQHITYHLQEKDTEKKCNHSFLSHQISQSVILPCPNISLQSLLYTQPNFSISSIKGTMLHASNRIACINFILQKKSQYKKEIIKCAYVLNW